MERDKMEIKTKPIFITKSIKFRQEIAVIFSSLLLLVDLFFLIFRFSSSMLLIFFIQFLAVILFNYFISKIYRIKVLNETIIVSNMWRKIEYTLDELKDINIATIVFPILLNPYLKFKFKDGKSFKVIVLNRIKIYFSKGGMNAYVSGIKDILLK